MEPLLLDVEDYHYFLHICRPQATFKARFPGELHSSGAIHLAYDPSIMLAAANFCDSLLEVIMRYAEARSTRSCISVQSF
jgi:hypothetical protein